MARSIQIKRIGYKHAYIVDWELAHPEGKMVELAHVLGVSETNLSIIRNSDAFIGYRDQRRREHNALISHSVIEHTESLAKTTLEMLETRIKNEGLKLGIGVLNETAEMTLRALGFGGGRGGNAQPGANVNIVIGAGTTPEQLAAARAKIKIVNQTPVEPAELKVLPETEILPASS